MVESLHISSSSKDDSKSISDEDFAFIVTSTISSYAFAANSYTDVWFADSGASEHMTDRLDWFSNFQLISEGIHTVQIADDTKLRVRGKGDIQIYCLIDGLYHNGLIQDVLSVPKLKRNFFLVGLVYERNLSFVTFPGRCEFITLSGKKVLQGIRFRKLYQLSITVILPIENITSGFLDSAHIATNYLEEACISESIPSQSHTVDYVVIANSSPDHDELILWHARMGHFNIDNIHQMSRNDSFCDFKLHKNVQL